MLVVLVEMLTTIWMGMNVWGIDERELELYKMET